MGRDVKCRGEPNVSSVFVVKTPCCGNIVSLILQFVRTGNILVFPFEQQKNDSLLIVCLTILSHGYGLRRFDRLLLVFIRR